jgi:hypothetical protein
MPASVSALNQPIMLHMLAQQLQACQQGTQDLLLLYLLVPCCCCCQVYSRYSGLPQQQPSSLRQQLQLAADLVAQDQVAAATAVLNDSIEWHLEDFVTSKQSDNSSFSNNSSGSAASLRVLFGEVIGAGAAAAPASAYLVPACVYALLLNTCDSATQQLNALSDQHDSCSSSSAPGTPMDSGAADDELFEAIDANNNTSNADSRSSSSSSSRSIVSSRDSPLQRLVKFQLEQITADAPQDTLAPAAASLQLLLGKQHPVAAAMRQLGERNMSFAARQAREMRRQQKTLARATEVLKVRCGIILEARLRRRTRDRALHT